VDKPTFDKMYSILLDAYVELHRQGGSPPKLSVLDKLVITLGYWREYRSYRNIAFDYGVKKSAIGNSVIWVEDTLIPAPMGNMINLLFCDSLCFGVLFHFSQTEE